jgi:hypothetical protein
MPIRKRTALVDQRISRSRLSGETNPQDLLEAQHALTNPRRPISPIPENKVLPVSSPTVNALGLGDPGRTEVDKPQSLATQETETPIDMRPSDGIPPVAAPAAPTPDRDAPPSFAEPNDSGDEGEGGFEDAASATMQYLASVGDAPEDQPISGATSGSGVTGLKRAGSGETSRLRGPRGKLYLYPYVSLLIITRCTWAKARWSKDAIAKW